ncbi:hypothetical protein AA313_de0206862 [Arthrobotrys entomopaga]|nr:hypothetical protein AA313_de0206862 [Arthrobotrys entomopaga]
MQHLETVAEKRVLHKVQRMQSSLSIFVDTSTFDRKRTPNKKNGLRKRRSKCTTESPLDSNGAGTPASKQTMQADSVSDGGSKHPVPHFQDVSGDGKLIKETRPAIIDRNSSMSSNASSLLSKGSVYSQTSLESDAASTPTITLNSLEVEPQTPEAAFKGIFSRACKLIRDALQIEGVVIIEAGDGYLDNSEESESLRSLSKGAQGSKASEETSRDVASSYFRQMGILGMDVPQQADQETNPNMFQTGPLGALFLEELFVNYPTGKIFSYDADGTISSGEEEEFNIQPTLSPLGSDTNSSVDDEISNLRKRPEYVRKNLSAFLPSSTSCIFMPLYESAETPYAFCFVWTTQTKKVFVKEEVGYLKTFARLIMSELVRLNTVSADKAKGAFISNISHELRSPLHGILASAELLDDTKLNFLQRDFLAAIESCGRTLLDTLNHVLDFSKLDRLRSDRKNIQASPLSAFDKVDTQAVQDVDLAAVTEEVVEGVFAGFDFRGINSHMVLENASTTDIIPLQPDASAIPNGEVSRRAFANRTNPKRDVEVIIDIDRIDDWIFRTEPGGFRRVVMNLVGNALKYTDKGYVHVKLEAKPYFEDGFDPTMEPKTKVVLTVSDSGRGISREFLRTKLFVPFSQENAMSSGTGLGMSIVHQILDILGGTIDVKSELGIGTDVTVTLLLHKAFGTPNDATSSSKDGKDEVLDITSQARAAASKKNIAFLGFNDTLPALRLLKGSLIKCSKDWYEMNVVGENDALSLMEFVGKADVLVANETCPLLSQLGVKGHKPPVIILCSNAARVDMSNLTLAEKGGIIDFASKPCGPQKLAKALLFCLTRTHSSRRSSHSSNASSRTGIYRTWNSFSRPMLDREKSFASAVDDDLPTGAVRISPPVRSGSSSSEPVVYVAGVGPIAAASGSSAVPMSSSPGRQKSIHFLEDFQALRLKAQAQTQASMQSISGVMHKDSHGVLAPGLHHNNNHGFHHLVDGALIGEGVEIDRPPFASPVMEKDNPLRPKSWAQWQSLNASADGDDSAPNSSLPLKATAIRPEDVVEELRILSETPSILLVDDNPTTMKLMTMYMTKKGFRFSEAYDGLQALEEFRRRTGGYDIILMDLQLPVMSGLDAVKAIRDIERTENRQHRAFIIALTGSSKEAEALAAGCDKFFTKPIKLAELSSMIAEYRQSDFTHIS